MEELFKSRSTTSQRTPSERDRQSVHTKFKLSGNALEATERLTEYWRMPQKKVAEKVIRLTVSFLEDEDEETQRWFVENAINQPGEVARKTHVMSREIKLTLEENASDFNLTRDQFFDASLRLADAIAKFLREVQLDRHEEQLPRLYDLLDQVESVEDELKGGAADADPLRPALASVREQLEAIVDDIEEELETGVPLAHSHEFT